MASSVDVLVGHRTSFQVPCAGIVQPADRVRPGARAGAAPQCLCVELTAASLAADSGSDGHERPEGPAALHHGGRDAVQQLPTPETHPGREQGVCVCV